MVSDDTSQLVLVWAPRGRDAALTVRMLERHGICAKECSGLDELLGSVEHVGCAVLTTESLTCAARDTLATRLEAQPPWSDFPMILFAPPRTDVADRGLDEIQSLGNVSILERPVQSGTLVTAIRAALRGRNRQYEARDAIHQRDQFLAMLGHELRNPLAAIMLALEALPGEAERSKPHAVIERQTHHLARLVDDLLDVARVTSGKVRIDPQPVDLADIVQRCLQSAELAARQRSMLLSFENASESGSTCVEGDLVRLEEVFNNLISNAIKYSPAGSRVLVRVKCDDASCIVEVKDHGIGITAEMLPRVFDLFTQVEGSLARSAGGLGIGLTLVKSLVGLHGGTVEASSPGLGYGSTFTVRLPRSTARTHAPASAASHEMAPLRVVLVDDNHDVLEMTRDLLEACGCEVATAPDGLSGLDLLIAKQPDIAFVDIGLPGIDGFQIAERARASKVDQTYLVAMSGYGQPEDQQRAIAAGFDRHLTKPVTVAALREAMGTAKRLRA